MICDFGSTNYALSITFREPGGFDGSANNKCCDDHPEYRPNYSRNMSQFSHRLSIISAGVKTASGCETNEGKKVGEGRKPGFDGG